MIAIDQPNNKAPSSSSSSSSWSSLSSSSLVVDAMEDDSLLSTIPSVRRVLQQEECPPDHSIDCYNNGICLIHRITNEPYCDCQDQLYTGIDCSVKYVVCTDEDKRKWHCYHEGSTCRYQPNKEGCNCPANYSGPNCNNYIGNTDSSSSQNKNTYGSNSNSSSNDPSIGMKQLTIEIVVFFGLILFVVVAFYGIYHLWNEKNDMINALFSAETNNNKNDGTSEQDERDDDDAAAAVAASVGSRNNVNAISTESTTAATTMTEDKEIV